MRVPLISHLESHRTAAACPERTRYAPGTTITRPLCRSGLALVELLLSITITAMITASVASITTAVARSEEFERERRESTVRSQAIDVRLAAYVTPSLAVLNAQDNALVLWLEDSRLSTTVHASEVRWINYDNLTGSIILNFVEFPEGWTQLEIDEADFELPSDTDWWAVFTTYENLGYINTLRLCDGIADFTISYNAKTEKSRKILTFNITFAGQISNRVTVCSSSIREYQEPTL